MSNPVRLRDDPAAPPAVRALLGAAARPKPPTAAQSARLEQAVDALAAPVSRVVRPARFRRGTTLALCAMAAAGVLALFVGRGAMDPSPRRAAPLQAAQPALDVRPEPAHAPAPAPTPSPVALQPAPQPALPPAPVALTPADRALEAQRAADARHVLAIQPALAAPSADPVAPTADSMRAPMRRPAHRAAPSTTRVRHSPGAMAPGYRTMVLE